MLIVNAARCPPRPSRARSVCGWTASSRAGQVAIQAWTGSGVAGPSDCMGPQESPRQGQGDAQDRASWAGPCLGWFVEGLGWARPAWVVAGWAGPEASLRHWAAPKTSLRHSDMSTPG